MVDCKPDSRPVGHIILAQGGLVNHFSAAATSSEELTAGIPGTTMSARPVERTLPR